MDTIRYGRQIGETHSDGSVLRKGSTFFGDKGKKYLLDKDGNILRFKERRQIAEDKFEILTGTPIPESEIGEHHIKNTLYSNIRGQRYIDETSFIGYRTTNERTKKPRWQISQGIATYNSMSLVG